MSIPGRITHNMMSQHLLTDLRRSNADVARTTQQISSQQRISSASDDPTGTHRALRLRAELAENGANQDGADAASGWTTASDSALSSTNDIVHRMRELVVQAGNDTLAPADRKQIASEMGQLLEQVKANANAKFGDQYVFAGQASTTAPYTAGASDAYAGDTGTVQRTIGPGQTVAVNVPGSSIFGGTAGDGKLLDTMRTAITALNAGTPAAANTLRTTVLASIDTNLDQILTARSTIGGVANRANLASDRLADVKLTLTSQLSKIEDTDMADAITSLSSQQTAYKAALQAGSNIIQPSLMDFLR